MKYICQIAVIFLFTLLGEVMAWLIPLPVPASIWGLLALFLALTFKIVKPEQIKEGSQWLIGLLPLLFVAPAVGLMDQFDALAPVLPALLVIIPLTTLLTLGAGGIASQVWIRKGRKGRKDA